MTGSEKQKFLAGLFATWLAADRGHETPSAKDRKAAEVIADNVMPLYHYDVQFGDGGTKGLRNMTAAQRSKLKIA